MRRYDKLNNMLRANLLTEQRYLNERLLDELSPELKQRAYTQADAESQKYGNEMGGEHNPLKSNRRGAQAHQFGSQVSSRYNAEIENIGTYIGLKGELKKDSHFGAKAYLNFTKINPDAADRILSYEITKKGYKPSTLNNVQIPDNIERRIERLLYKIQATELPSEEPDNTL